MKGIQDLKTNNDIIQYLSTLVESNQEVTEYVSKLIELQGRNIKIRKTLPGICERLSKKYSSESSEEHPEYAERWVIVRSILEQSSERGGASITSNLTIQSVNLTNNQKALNQGERLEFDPSTGKLIPDPLKNLIIEEVDVSDYM